MKGNSEILRYYIRSLLIINQWFDREVGVGYNQRIWTPFKNRIQNSINQKDFLNLSFLWINNFLYFIFERHLFYFSKIIHRKLRENEFRISSSDIYFFFANRIIIQLFPEVMLGKLCWVLELRSYFTTSHIINIH